MKEFKIKNQMATLSQEEKKLFLNGLIKSAKNTKFVNDLEFFLKASAYPMITFGSIVTTMGVATIIMGATNFPIELGSDRIPMVLLGIMGSLIGVSGIVCVLPNSKNAIKEAKRAKEASLTAKQDIKMLKQMKKNVILAEGREN